MSWKKYGGISNLENFNNIIVNTIVADVLSVRKYYVGDWDICGSLLVKYDSTVYRNSLIYGNLDVSGANTHIRGNAKISRNTEISGNLVVYDDTYLKKYLYFDPSGNTLVHGTNHAFGFNKYNPTATIDISSDQIYTVKMKTSHNTNRNIYAQNAGQQGILMGVDPTKSYINMFVDSSMNDGAGTVNAKLEYIKGGDFLIDVSNVMRVRPRMVFSRDITKNMNSNEEQVVIYDSSELRGVSYPYINDNYNDSRLKSGVALTAISKDNSSNIFIKMTSEEGKGATIGGGPFEGGMMASLALIDSSASNFTKHIYPALNIFSGNLISNLKTSIGINKYRVSKTDLSENRYSLDVNGPMKLIHQEMLMTLDVSMHVLALGMSPSKKVIYAVGSPFTSSVPFQQYFLKSNNAGYSWTTTYIQVGSGIESGGSNFKTVFAYSDSFVIIAGDSGLIYYTLDGGTNWTRINYSGITTFFNINSLILIGGSQNAIIGLSNGNFFNVPNITNTEINSSHVRNTSLGTINSVDGSGNIVFFAGVNGIQGYNINSQNISSIFYTGLSFNDVSLYYDGSTYHVVAVGNGRIAYAHTNTHTIENWISLENTPYNLKKVKVFNSSFAIAIGDNGLLVYSNTGFGTWNVITKKELDAMGNGPIFDSLNFTSIVSTSVNDFVISGCFQPFIGGTQQGRTKMIHFHAPYFFNRDNNFVLEASGSILLSGDMNVNHDGKLRTNFIDGVSSSNTNTLQIGNLYASKILIGSTDVTTDIRIGKQDGSLISSRGIHANIHIGDSNSDVNIYGNLFINDGLNLSGAPFVSNEYAMFMSDVSINGILNVNSDVSLNSRLFVNNDVSFNSKLMVMSDVSFNSRLFVNNDVSFNSRLFVKNFVSIGKSSPLMSLDISYADGIRLPTGTTDERPIKIIAPNSFQTQTGTTISTLDKSMYVGTIRYNTTNSQFEGFGPGDSWGSLGGVINVAQNTKIVASSPNADSTNNELMFFTAPTGNVYTSAAIERMRIAANGDVSINSNVFVGYDVSFNKKLFVKNFVSIGKPSPLMSLDISYADGIRLPTGTTDERPIRVVGSNNFQTQTGTTISAIDKSMYVGTIRYNTTNSQFEGFGPGDSWGSLGGVINVAQNTKIIASSPNADSTNNELIFYTAPIGNVYTSAATERMRIAANGDVSMNDKLFVRSDVSFNSKLTVGSNLTAYGFKSIGNNSTSENTQPDFNEDGTRNHNLLLVSTKPVSASGTTPYSMSLGVDYATGCGYINAAGNSIAQPIRLQTRGGNVGIGASTPTFKLDVNGESGTLLRLQNNSGGYSTGMRANIDFNNSHVSPMGRISSIDVTSSNSGVWQTALAFYVRQHTGNILEGMRITAKSETVDDCVDVKINGNVEAKGLSVNGSTLDTTNPTVNISKDVGLAANFSSWQHSAQLQVKELNGNSMALAMSTNGVGIIQGKKQNIGYNNVSINPIGGGVTIGKINPTAGYELDVNGDVQATTYNATSDYRIKENIKPLDVSFNVDVLNPVIYNLKSSGKQDIGFIAHEVQEFYPFLVNGVKDGPDNQSINYNGFIGILTKEIKDLKKEMRIVRLELEAESKANAKLNSDVSVLRLELEAESKANTKLNDDFSKLASEMSVLRDIVQELMPL